MDDLVTRLRHAAHCARMFSGKPLTDSDPRRIEDEAADEITALREKVASLKRLHISFDGPYTVNEDRWWLARKLLDSKSDDKEAYGIVAYHPAIVDARP